jgi:hypothetical protein
MTDPNPTERGTDRIAAALIALGVLLSLVLVLHHPVLHSGHGATPGAVADAISRLAVMDEAVHGLLMLVACGQAVGYYFFAARIGLRRPLAVAGFFFFALSIAILVVPATLDGFVTPALAARCAEAPGSCTISMFDSFGLVSAMIQAFTRIAFAAQAIAMLAWSAALVRAGGKARIAGLMGAVLALVPLVLLFAIPGRIDPHRLMQIVAAEGVWSLGAAALLMLGWVGAQGEGAEAGQ